MNPLAQEVGWMLVHSVWEDVLVWCVLQLGLLALARKSPQSRYLAAGAALVAMAVLPWLTFDASDLAARLRSHASAQVSAMSVSPRPGIFETAAVGEDTNRGTESFSPAYAATEETPTVVPRVLGVLAGLWLGGLVLSSGRLWLNWRGVRRLLRQPFRLPNPAWRQRFAQLRRRTGIDRLVRLGESAAVAAPIVAGWLKPVILLPLGVMTSLPAELEAILLHELAHIARHDYLVNLLQSVVETVFFYHPAVWAVSRRIRRERELACDDQAVAWCENPRTYAEALAGFEEFRGRALFLAATGGGDLFTRIHRILTGPGPERRGAGIMALAGLGGIGLYLATMLLAPVLAESVMTAKERVAQIEALQPAPPPESMPDSLRPSTEEITIGGTIRMEGAPLPASLHENGGLHGIVSSRRPNNTTNATLYVEPGGVLFGTVPQGRIGIGLWGQGYAPFLLDGLRGAKGKLNLEIELKRGFLGRVRVTGPDGRPVPGVAITATASDPDSGIDLPAPAVRTNDEGMATFGKVNADSQIRLTAVKPGWQMADLAVAQWSDGKVAPWMLRPATPTLGQAVDGGTKKAIANAEIVMAERRGMQMSDSMSFDPATGQPLGRTDENGRFELDGLNEDYTYRIYFRAPGYQTESFPIQPGDRDKVFELARGLQVRGKILDPAGELKQLSERLGGKVQLRCAYVVQGSPHTSFGQEKVYTFSTPGPVMPFAFDDLPRGNIQFLLNRKWYSLVLQKNVDDFVIDLGAHDEVTTPDEPPKREVKITIKTGAGQITPAGALDMDYLDPSEGPIAYNSLTVPLRDGAATTELPVPTKVNLRAKRLAGYFFEPESLDVPAGTGVFTRTIEAFPAGVIHGKIEALGWKGHPFTVESIVIRKPEGWANLNLTSGGDTSQPLGESYVTSPLPFGGGLCGGFAIGPELLRHAARGDRCGAPDRGPGHEADGDRQPERAVRG